MKSINFEAPSSLKPRNKSITGSSSSVTSSYSAKSKSHHKHIHYNDAEQPPNDQHDGDDVMSLSETIIQQMWRKRRSRRHSSKYRHLKESPEIFQRFVNIAKVLLLLFFVSLNIHFYNTKLPSNEVLTIQNDEKISNITSVNDNELEVMSDEAKQRIRMKLQRIKESELDVPRLATKPSRMRQHNPSLIIPQNIDKFYQDIALPRTAGDVPVFWHILKSGGTTMKDIFGACMGKVESSEAGVLEGHINDSTIQKINLHSVIEYVNG